MLKRYQCHSLKIREFFGGFHGLWWNKIILRGFWYSRRCHQICCWTESDELKKILCENEKFNQLELKLRNFSLALDLALDLVPKVYSTFYLSKICLLSLLSGENSNFKSLEGRDLFNFEKICPWFRKRVVFESKRYLTQTYWLHFIGEVKKRISPTINPWVLTLSNFTPSDRRFPHTNIQTTERLA